MPVLTFKSVEDLAAVIEASDAGAYGFVVSQDVYDRMRAKHPGRFQGGNSFQLVPIIVDPDVADCFIEVAFTAQGWRERVARIRV